MNTSASIFKTTIHCGSCIEKVQSTLDELLGKGKWQVDTQSADKVLQTDNDTFDEEELILRLAELGYAATPIQK